MNRKTKDVYVFTVDISFLSNIKRIIISVFLCIKITLGNIAVVISTTIYRKTKILFSINLLL